MLKLVILENQMFILFIVYFFALHPAVFGANSQLGTWGHSLACKACPLGYSGFYSQWFNYKDIILSSFLH